MKSNVLIAIISPAQKLHQNKKWHLFNFRSVMHFFKAQEIIATINGTSCRLRCIVEEEQENFVSIFMLSNTFW